MKRVISVTDISKMYRLGQFNTGALSQDIERWWALFRGKEDPFLKIGETNDRSKKGASNIVWSLKDISFDIEQGSATAIIGKNGAGKSTLLKLLSRVTTPTTGSIKIKGRVASLLEVGTGFHPELTGKENIFLNGAILGMKKQEIISELDAIVDFAGVERYLDTPVKRYSSGMFVRLGFAVAAHLRSEILIVDEVLAVGDAEFQKKAIGKMKDVSSGQGRTILFVSHNMASVKSLCSSGILLANGRIEKVGEVREVVNEYLGTGSEGLQDKNFAGIDHEKFEIKDLYVQDEERARTGFDENSILQLRVDFLAKVEKLHLTFILKNENDEVLFTFSHSRQHGQLSKGSYQIACEFPPGFLNIDSYYIDMMVIEEKKKCILEEKVVSRFSVHPGQRAIGAWMGKEPGFIRPRFNWTIE